MSAHTPGPWFIGASLGIHTNNGMPYIANVPTGRGDKQREANARLIAAAPDLLAVAEMISNGPHDAEAIADMLPLVCAAIAKAKGKT